MHIILKLMVMSEPQKGNITTNGVTAPGEFVSAQVEDEGSPFNGACIPVVIEFGNAIKKPILKKGDVVEACYHVGNLREFSKEPGILFFEKKL